MASQSDLARAEKLYRYAVALKRQGQLEQALGAYDTLVELIPDSAEAHNNRGNLLDELGRFDDAAAALARATQLKPDYAEAHNNRGVALMHAYRYDEALASYERAIVLNGDYAEAWSNRGNTLKELARLGEALDSYDQALAVNPRSPDTMFNKALALLLKGNFAAGLPLYEGRWAQNNNAVQRRAYPQPLWLGDAPIAGKTILLYGEQGLGDAIQFARYAALVAERGARVMLQVEDALVELLRTLDGVELVIGPKEPLPAFDFHCPLLSLPLAFKTDVTTIPAPASYLRADPARSAEWARRLGPKTKPRIGVVWSSLSKFGDDAKRSVSLAEFKAALPEDGFEIICLQKEMKPQDQVALASMPALRFVGDQLATLADTAALIDQLDLIVSTCTSVPHLAGALGKPTWILLSHVPDWRWMMAGRESPWYPNARLYRQRAIGAWREVFEEVRADLCSRFG